ncbi:hypothetical protein MTBPR1_150054 [Candidatus Terasakiella magnetica]|uniref:Uncharacterized protein n=1 Tax=Candidatus Terasakiella magnetica TaxID=1867952 RepID=A0A1C3RFE4_9PROT|nr:hypothetical protein MTBPR1_150054 [Candidatus Terasakiella magnetica]
MRSLGGKPIYSYKKVTTVRLDLTHSRNYQKSNVEVSLSKKY